MKCLLPAVLWQLTVFYPDHGVHGMHVLLVNTKVATLCSHSHFLISFSDRIPFVKKKRVLPSKPLIGTQQISWITTLPPDPKAFSAFSDMSATEVELLQFNHAYSPFAYYQSPLSRQNRSFQKNVTVNGCAACRWMNFVQVYSPVLWIWWF